MRPLLLLLAALSLHGQQFTFSPQPKVSGIHATVWGVTVSCTCTVKPSDVYAVMVSKGLSPIYHDAALDMIHLHDYRSPFKQILMWAAPLPGIASGIVSSGLVNTSAGIRSAVGIGALVIGLVLPVVDRNQPPPITVEQRLLSVPVKVTPDADAEFVVFSQPSKLAAFEVNK